MLIVLPNEGLQDLIDKIVSNNLVLKLFANDITPARTDTLASFTEASVAGYAEVLLVNVDWSAPAMSGNTAYSQTLPKSFAADATLSETVYGWYLTNYDEDTVIAAARFDAAPVTLNDVGFSVIAYMAFASVFP